VKTATRITPSGQSGSPSTVINLPTATAIAIRDHFEPAE